MRCRFLLSLFAASAFAFCGSQVAHAQSQGYLNMANHTTHAVWVTIYLDSGQKSKTAYACILPGRGTQFITNGLKKSTAFYPRAEVKASATSCDDHSNIADHMNYGGLSTSYTNYYVTGSGNSYYFNR